MKNRYRSRSISLLALGAAVVLIAQPGAQSRQATWYSLTATTASPTRQEIERRTTDALRQAYGGLAVSSLSAADLSQVLSSRAPGDLTFLAGRAADVVDFVRNDRLNVVDNLKLEVLNVRLGATPFYLFTNAEKAAAVRQVSPQPRVLYMSRAGALQPGDVQPLIAKVLGAQPVVPAPLNSPDELARRLLADRATDGVDAVGIFDDDPSPFLHDFLRAYDAQKASAATAAGSRQLIQMVPLSTGSTPAERDRLATDRLQQGPGNIAFLLVRFDDVAVESLDSVAPRQKDGVLAISAGRGDIAPDSLLVLSNVGRLAGDAARQQARHILGDAYFVGLMMNDDFRNRCDSGGARYGPYLLDAQTADRENAVKALAYWSDLILRSGSARPADLARLTDQIMLFGTVLRQRLDVDVNSNEGRSALSAKLQGPKSSVRVAFSDDDGKLFDQAVEKIQLALQANDRAVRAKQLAEGRALLIALIEKQTTPSCRGKGAGLFGRGLDPFFYLGAIDAFTALDVDRINPTRPPAVAR